MTAMSKAFDGLSRRRDDTPGLRRRIWYVPWNSLYPELTCGALNGPVQLGSA